VRNFAPDQLRVNSSSADATIDAASINSQHKFQKFMSIITKRAHWFTRYSI